MATPSLCNFIFLRFILAWRKSNSPRGQPGHTVRLAARFCCLFEIFVSVISPRLFLLFSSPLFFCFLEPYHPWCWPQAALPKVAAPVILTQSGPQLPPCRHALPARSCCLAAVSPMLLQWCAPLPPICRWMRAPLPSLCKWWLGLLSVSPNYIDYFPQYPCGQPGHTVRLTTRLSLFHLFLPPVGTISFSSKKKRSRPNWVASLGILSGSLPGSSCLSVPVGASLYSFLLSPSSSPSLFIPLTPLPIHNSLLSIPWRSPDRFPSPPLHPWGQRNGPPTLYDSRTMS